MNGEKLQEQLNKKILLYLLCLIPCIVFMIPGFYLLIELKIIFWGIFFLILSGLSLIIPTIILIIYSHKMWSLINDSIVKEIKGSLNSSSDVEFFKTENGEYVNFYDDYFIYNQEIVYYENSIFMAVANSHKKNLSNNVCISLLIHYKEKKLIIKINKDLLNVIRNNKNIILSNREDLEYFMNNINECSKKNI